ncbi:MAG: flagellar biosynthetic protein FliO [Comamonas sp.]
MDNTGFTSSLLALCLVIAALLALPWLLKRWQLRQRQQQGVQAVSTQVLSSAHIGPNQRVVTIEVGQGAQKTCLVLGVTAHNIHCLHVLGQPSGAAAKAPDPVTFAGAMAQIQDSDHPQP